MFVDQGLASEVRRREDESFERDPAVLAMRIEHFPPRQVHYRKFEEVDDDAPFTSGPAGPSDAPLIFVVVFPRWLGFSSARPP